MRWRRAAYTYLLCLSGLGVPAVAWGVGKGFIANIISAPRRPRPPGLHPPALLRIAGGGVVTGRMATKLAGVAVKGAAGGLALPTVVVGTV